MGGFIVWRMISMRPSFFRSAVIVSGGPEHITGFMGVLRTNAVDHALLERVTTPVWVMHGNMDLLTSRRVARRAYTRLVMSQPRRATFYAYTGHVGAMKRAFRDVELYKWIEDPFSR